MADLPENVITAQRTVDQAWAALEIYRMAVDAARHTEARPTKDGPAATSALRAWNEQETAEYDRLHAAAVAAAEARATTMTANGRSSDFATEYALREATRSGGEPAEQEDASA
jgi:hypothetical protein